MPFIETRSEFTERMSCPFEEQGFGEETVLHFENGGVSVRETVHRDPPVEIGALIQQQLNYQTIALNRKVTVFNQMKDALHENITHVKNSPNSLPMDFDGALPVLKQFQAEVLGHRQTIAELREKYLTQTEEGRNQTRRLEAERAQKRQLDEALARASQELSNIKI